MNQAEADFCICNTEEKAWPSTTMWLNAIWMRPKLSVVEAAHTIKVHRQGPNTRSHCTSNIDLMPPPQLRIDLL